MKNVALMALFCMGFFSVSSTKMNLRFKERRIERRYGGNTLSRVRKGMGVALPMTLVEPRSMEKAEDQEIGKYSHQLLWCGGFSYGLDMAV